MLINTCASTTLLLCRSSPAGKQGPANSPLLYLTIAHTLLMAQSNSIAVNTASASHRPFIISAHKENNGSVATRVYRLSSLQKTTHKRSSHLQLYKSQHIYSCIKVNARMCSHMWAKGNYFSWAPNMFLFILNLSKLQSFIDIKGKSLFASLRQYIIAGTWFAQKYLCHLRRVRWCMVTLHLL